MLIYNQNTKNNLTKVRVRSKVNRTHTFVRGQRCTKVRPCGRPLKKKLISVKKNITKKNKNTCGYLRVMSYGSKVLYKRSLTLLIYENLVYF